MRAAVRSANRLANRRNSVWLLQREFFCRLTGFSLTDESLRPWVSAVCRLYWLSSTTCFNYSRANSASDSLRFSSGTCEDLQTLCLFYLLRIIPIPAMCSAPAERLRLPGCNRERRPGSAGAVARDAYRHPDCRSQFTGRRWLEPSARSEPRALA